MAVPESHELVNHVGVLPIVCRFLLDTGLEASELRTGKSGLPGLYEYMDVIKECRLNMYFAVI